MITDYNGYAGSPSEIEFSEAAPESTKTIPYLRVTKIHYVVIRNIDGVLFGA